MTNYLNKAEPATLTANSPYYHLHYLAEHIHSESKCYPTGAAGVTITGGAGAWTLGDYAEIVPASTITSEFDIHFINIEGANANDTYEIVLYAVTTEIARFRITTVDIANARILPEFIIFTPIIAANSQIQAKCMTSGGGEDTVTISIHYHTY